MPFQKKLVYFKREKYKYDNSDYIQKEVWKH